MCVCVCARACVLSTVHLFRSEGNTLLLPSGVMDQTQLVRSAGSPVCLMTHPNISYFYILQNCQIWWCSLVGYAGDTGLPLELGTWLRGREVEVCRLEFNWHSLYWINLFFLYLMCLTCILLKPWFKMKSRKILSIIDSSSFLPSLHWYL